MSCFFIFICLLRDFCVSRFNIDFGLNRDAWRLINLSWIGLNGVLCCPEDFVNDILTLMAFSLYHFFCAFLSFSSLFGSFWFIFMIRFTHYLSPLSLSVDSGCYNSLISDRGGHRGLRFTRCPVEVHRAPYHHPYCHSHRTVRLQGCWREGRQTLGHCHAVSTARTQTRLAMYVTDLWLCGLNRLNSLSPLFNRTIFLVLLFSQYARNIQLPLPIYKSKKGWTSYRLQLFKMFPVSFSILFQDKEARDYIYSI